MATTQWNIDRAHSAIQFKAKHLMITTVTGNFTSYDARVETEGEDFSTVKIAFTADTGSVSTGNEQRDGHLKSADFFDAEHYPKMSFVSKHIEPGKEAGHYRLTGDLTIKEVTKPVTLDAQFDGMVKDPWGNMKSAFTLEGKINRKDWGLVWNVALETGGVLVSEEIRILCEIQLAKGDK